MKLIVALALAVWVGRWAVIEVASFVSRRLPRRPPPIESPRQPGRLPGPFD